MAFKLTEAAEAWWRAVNAPHLVALVRAGAVFEKGKLIERPVGSSTTKEAACRSPIHNDLTITRVASR
jgi:hypothetical protein